MAVNKDCPLFFYWKLSVGPGVASILIEFKEAVNCFVFDMPSPAFGVFEEHLWAVNHWAGPVLAKLDLLLVGAVMEVGVFPVVEQFSFWSH